MWLSETKRKFILSLILILAFVVVAVLLFTDRKQTSEQQSRLHTVMEEMKALERERDDLEEKLEKLDEMSPDVPVRTATAQIVVTELREELYTSVYPAMKEYGMSGVLALSGESFAGVDGQISREQFGEMTGDGWDICLFWDGNGDLETWLSGMEENLAQEALAMPEVLYVGDTNGIWNYDTICLNHGIHIVVHRREDESAMIATSADAEPSAQADQEETVTSVVQDEERTEEDRAELEKTQVARSGNRKRNASVVTATERVTSADVGEPGYRYSAASASDARSSAAVSENPLIEPLQVPLTQAAASVDTIPGGDVDEAVWHLDSLVWNGQDLSEAVTSLVESGGNLTFELGVPFDEKGFYQLEEADILRSGVLELRSFAEARETMLEYRRSLEVWERQKEEERKQIQSRMKELDARIEEMALGHN